MKKIILIQVLQIAVVLLVFFMKYEPGHEINAALAAMLAGILSAIVFVRLYLESSFINSAIGGFSLTSIVTILGYLGFYAGSNGMIVGVIFCEFIIIILFQLVAEDLYQKSIDWKKRGLFVLVPIIGGGLIWWGMELITKIPYHIQ